MVFHLVLVWGISLLLLPNNKTKENISNYKISNTDTEYCDFLLGKATGKQS